MDTKVKASMPEGVLLAVDDKVRGCTVGFLADSVHSLPIETAERYTKNKVSDAKWLACGAYLEIIDENYKPKSAKEEPEDEKPEVDLIDAEFEEDSEENTPEEMFAELLENGEVSKKGNTYVYGEIKGKKNIIEHLGQ